MITEQSPSHADPDESLAGKIDPDGAAVSAPLAKVKKTKKAPKAVEKSGSKSAKKPKKGKRDRELPASASSKPIKPDDVGLEAVAQAHAALVELVDPAHVGDHVSALTEGKRVTTHHFVSTLPGYRGWVWSVTLSRAPKQRFLTTSEVVLLPSEDAILAPDWVPWRERVQPGDFGPGDLLPVDDDDFRLVPGYTAGDEVVDRASVKRVADEVGLGRKRVLSLEGRDAAAQRWYDSEQGPDSALAQSAPGRCGTCGFLVRLAGPLAVQFGVCANGQANDDGRVVTLNHGCGGHSEAKLGRRHEPVPLPDPYFDTIRRQDLDRF